MLLTGGCHCGNIALELDWDQDPPEIPARACDCSFCVKHGGVWASHPQARLGVTVREPARVSRYAFATGTATFHICSNCGVVPLVTSDIDGHTYAVVNVNALHDVEPTWLRKASVTFGDEAVEARLARRARGWIADVRVVARVDRLG